MYLRIHIIKFTANNFAKNTTYATNTTYDMMGVIISVLNKKNINTNVPTCNFHYRSRIHVYTIFL